MIEIFRRNFLRKKPNNQNSLKFYATPARSGEITDFGVVVVVVVVVAVVVVVVDVVGFENFEK